MHHLAVQGRSLAVSLSYTSTGRVLDVVSGGSPRGVIDARIARRDP
jgi:hypothetical protein